MRQGTRRCRHLTCSRAIRSFGEMASWECDIAHPQRRSARGMHPQSSAMSAACDEGTFGAIYRGGWKGGWRAVGRGWPACADRRS
eukprot:scaffold22893_cov27-Tisochrysis_lutea.AAC.5